MWSWVPPLFWIVWLLGVVFVVVAAFTSGGLLFSRLFAWSAASILVIALVLTGLNALGDQFEGDGNIPTAETPSVVPQKTPDQCVDGFNVVLDKNLNDRLISEGVDVSHPKKAIDEVLTSAKHDPRNLQVYYNATPLGKQAPVKDSKSLVEDGCYSAEGRDIWNQTYAQYKSATVKRSQAPAEGTNTFVNASTGSYQETGQITGNRDAVKVTFTNGDRVHILKRCGNVVSETPIPNVPVKPHPKPKQKCVPPLVPYKHRCVKPEGQHDTDGAGGDESPAKQPVGEHSQGPTSGAPTTAPPPPVRPSGDPDGGSGDGGAPAPTDPDDNSDSGQTTSPSPTAEPSPCSLIPTC
jgi:hypothetical protein